MRKISVAVVAILIAGWGCGGQSGLQSAGRDAGAGGAMGGQAGGTAAVGGTGGGTGGITIVATGGVGGATGGTGGCPTVRCPASVCPQGTESTLQPCGCPICVPLPDAGAAVDAASADTRPAGPLPACPMLESLTATDAARVNWGVGRVYLECRSTSGVTEGCITDDVAGCPGSVHATGDVIACSDRCANNEYGLSFGGIGPGATQPSIEIPAGCRDVLLTPAGVGFACCPCSEASNQDAAPIAVPPDAGAEAGGPCPPGLVQEGTACPKYNLQCPGIGNDRFCSDWHCTCGADRTWVCTPGVCQ